MTAPCITAPFLAIALPRLVAELLSPMGSKEIYPLVPDKTCPENPTQMVCKRTDMASCSKALDDIRFLRWVLCRLRAPHLGQHHIRHALQDMTRKKRVNTRTLLQILGLKMDEF